MKIYLHEITDLETKLDFTEADAWLREAVERVDEPGTEAGRQRAPRTTSAHFSLRKVDDVVVAQGDLHAAVRLLCSRCANPFDLKAEPHFSTLFCKDPVMAGVAHLEGEGKPAGQNKGFARHAHDDSSDESPSGGASDLDITYVAEDYLDLASVVTEQLQLQIPFQPLCRQNCKGICTNCGADLNVGRCACAKLTKASPFSVLKDLKISQNSR